MTFSIVATDRTTGRVVKRYTRKNEADAQALMNELTARGFGVELSTPTGRNRRRRNPGELLILSGYSANPSAVTSKPLADDLITAGQEMETVAEQFKRFHDGAEVLDIIEVPDDAIPPKTNHLWALGELVAVVYEVPSHSGKAPGPPFEHKLGEVGFTRRVVKKNRPLLCATADGKYLVIVHRNKPGSKQTYRVQPEGIVG